MIGTELVRHDGARLALQAFADGLAPPPKLTVREWADQHRRLPTKGASEPGPWRTSRVPFLGEIMDCLAPAHPARRVVLVKSAQVGGTEVGLNWLGWIIDTQRAPAMAVQPTLEMAERWSKQRLQAMIDVCPTLRAKVAPARSRDSGNTTLLKEWPGGVAIISGANSAAGLRSMPARFLFCDEIDAYPPELEGEGDPIKLAEARTATFPRRKVLLVSTPTIESLSRIWREWLASDQRHYRVPCPYCGEAQVLEWDNLRWPDRQPEAVLYHCRACGVGIAEHHKPRMLAGGAWIAEHPERAVPGFHVNGLYTPIGLGLSWAELATEWDEVRQDASRAKTFQNIRLGLCVSDPTERLELDELRDRAEAHALGTIAPGCLVLTAGVDVQKDRWAVLVLGHGRNGAQWVVDYTEIPGDPTRADEWARIDEYLAQSWPNSRGIPLKIVSCAVDAGFLPDDVLYFTRSRRGRGVFGVKGAGLAHRPIINRPTKVDITWRGSTIRGGAELWIVGVDSAKQALFTRLAADRRHVLATDRLIHFPAGLDEAFYSQLTAEVWDPNKRRWVKIRPRNEALDTWCYALAAAHHPAVRIHAWKEPRWAQLEAVLEPVVGDLFTGTAPRPDPPAAPEPTPAQPRPAPPRLSRSFVRGWRP